jgi:hypothetical protein
VASNKKSKVEAVKKRDNKKEEPPGADASKKTKAANTTGTQAASKKTTSTQAASSHTVASADEVSTQARAVKRTKKVPAKGALGNRKPRKQRVRAVSEGTKPEAAELDPFEVAKQTMKGSVPAIVEAMVELAKQGSCSHAKTLLEMTGAKHMFDDGPELEDSGEPWAKLVLERMDEAEQESLEKALPEVAAET